MLGEGVVRNGCDVQYVFVCVSDFSFANMASGSNIIQICKNEQST